MTTTFPLREKRSARDSALGTEIGMMVDVLCVVLVWRELNCVD